MRERPVVIVLDSRRSGPLCRSAAPPVVKEASEVIARRSEECLSVERSGRVSLVCPHSQPCLGGT